MKIESIRIQGYRSLADLELHPRPLTVLVGPNNSGKSNILDAIGFIADVYDNGPTFAIDRRGGFANLSFREGDVPGHDISIEVTIGVDAREIWGVPSTVPLPIPRGYRHGEAFSKAKLLFRHRLAIRGEGETLISRFRVVEEEIELSLNARLPVSVFSAIRSDGQVHVESSPDSSSDWLGLPFLSAMQDDEALFSSLLNAGSRPEESFVHTLRAVSPVVRTFMEYLKRFRTFDLVPDICRTAASPSPTAYLGSQGENLPALVYYLKDSFDPASWNKILESLSVMLPDLEDIEVRPTADRLWQLEFREEGIGNKWNAEEVSDGTIRALALFSSIYDPRNALLAFEEPENSLHPWILRAFVEACRDRANAPSAKQIILTTHSPILIDWLVPAEVAVVWRERGRTQVQPLLDLDPDLASAWDDGEVKLSSLLDSGLLRQTVPLP